jgi:hypothetical protein
MPVETGFLGLIGHGWQASEGDRARSYGRDGRLSKSLDRKNDDAFGTSTSDMSNSATLSANLYSFFMISADAAH